MEVQNRARRLTDPAILAEYGDGWYPLRWVYDKGGTACGLAWLPACDADVVVANARTRVGSLTLFGSRLGLVFTITVFFQHEVAVIYHKEHLMGGVACCQPGTTIGMYGGNAPPRYSFVLCLFVSLVPDVHCFRLPCMTSLNRLVSIHSSTFRYRRAEAVPCCTP